MKWHELTSKRRTALCHAGIAIIGALALTAGILMMGDHEAAKTQTEEENSALMTHENTQIVLPSGDRKGVATEEGEVLATGLPYDEASIENDDVIAENMPNEGYVLQFGVFGLNKNAAKLKAELSQQGFPARIESRVILGPYPDRETAEKAREQMQHLALHDSIIVALRGKR